MPNSDATRFIEAYCDTLAGVEVQTVDGKKRDKARTLSVLKSLSRNIGTLATEATILSDVASHYASFSRHTLADNMVALDKLFVTDNLSA